ncbi:MAG TPA: hypothetical protein VJ851_04710 [Jatrophihabitans sp.]|jgi:uncharacterized membrane protein HdeD (DUF308 family)|nr:hypothetical protein [Jatrophihabitans sp.]
MSYVLTAVLGVLLVAATVVGIVTANKDGQRPGSSQSHTGVVLYGGR